MLQQLEEIDNLAESRELSAAEWQKRYEIENELENIYQKEAIYWQQRGSDVWVLERDANTQFFHQHANGRRRKNTIISLETNLGEVRCQQDIMSHVTSFYKNLFGSQPPSNMRLATYFWQGRHNLPATLLDNLIKPFTELEVKNVRDEMKSNSTHDPNGFGV